jgi:hypothetical protein
MKLMKDPSLALSSAKPVANASGISPLQLFNRLESFLCSALVFYADPSRFF